MSKTTPFRFCNQLYFDIFDEKAHKDILPFLKIHFPFLYKKPKKKGGWTLYPPGKQPQFISCVHSFVFTRHPYFTEHFSEGRMEIDTDETTDGVKSLKGFRIFFDFDTITDAKKGLKKMLAVFQKKESSVRLLKYRAESKLKSPTKKPKHTRLMLH